MLTRFYLYFDSIFIFQFYRISKWFYFTVFSCPEQPLVEFAFRVFDTANQESLSSYEIDNLVDTIWGNDKESNQ